MTLSLNTDLDTVDISAEFSYGSGASQHTADVPLNVVKCGKLITLTAYIDATDKILYWFNIPNKYKIQTQYGGTPIQIAGVACSEDGKAYYIYSHERFGLYSDDNIIPSGPYRVRASWYI